MAPKLAKGLDTLGDLSDEEEEAALAAPAAPKVDYETLQRSGYRSGPSVLFIPEQRAEAAGTWAWSRGEKGAEGPESTEERERMRHAVGAGVDDQIAAQLRAAEHAKALREAEKAEQAEAKAAAREKLSFNAREKRKRERGQAIGGGNFVEEEKRLGRSFGIFSGFDT